MEEKEKLKKLEELEEIIKALRTHITILTFTFFLILFLGILNIPFQIEVYQILIGLLSGVIEIIFFVFLIKGIVRGFKLGQKVVGILYIIGLFSFLLAVIFSIIGIVENIANIIVTFLPLLAFIGSIIAVVKIKKARQTLEKTINTNAFSLFIK